jgi:hypothetical protein
MLVPDITAVAVFEVGHAASIEVPGAKMSTQGPLFENDDSLSYRVEEPTVIAAGSDAGE